MLNHDVPNLDLHRSKSSGQDPQIRSVMMQLKRADLHEPAQHMCSKRPGPCIGDMLLDVVASCQHGNAKQQAPTQARKRLKRRVVQCLQSQVHKCPVDFKGAAQGIGQLSGACTLYGSVLFKQIERAYAAMLGGRKSS